MFVGGFHIKPTLMTKDRARVYQSATRATESVRKSCKCLTGSKTQAYFSKALIKGKNRNINKHQQLRAELS